MLAHLAPPQPAQAPVELVPVERARRVRGGQFPHRALGRVQQFRPLAAALGRDQRVVADQQALAGEVRRRHAGESVPVEQAGLDHLPVGQLADGVVAQGGDPVEAGRLQVRVDARLADHAAIPDHGHLIQAVAVAQAGHLAGQRVGVGDVAGEALHGHGAAVGIVVFLTDPMADFQIIPAVEQGVFSN